MDMENKETFKMTYSAQQMEEVERIRKKYAPQEEDKMARLRELDARAGKKATPRAIAVGVIGALLMGTGMSLVMTDSGAALGMLAMPAGIAVGVVGLTLMVCAYPLYERTLKKEQEKVAPELLRLTEELMQ